MTYINTRGWLRRMGARIGGQVGLTGGAIERAGGHCPPLCMLKNALVYMYVREEMVVMSGGYTPSSLCNTA